MTGNTSNHHRYGEVKTRLTIGAGGDFDRFRPSSQALPLRQPLESRHASGTWWKGCLSIV